MAKYLVIGGVAGGATVAARLRRMDEQAEIVLLERGAYVSYANCGLPYYIGGVIQERERLLVQTVAGFKARFRVDVRPLSEAVSIDPQARKVMVRKVDTQEMYEETYDKLVLSPGAEPLRPGIPGIDLPHIFTLRHVPDTDTIKGYIKQQQPRSAVIVGGGFIGLEMAENLHHAGVQVSVVEMGRQVMAPLDFSMASLVHQHLLEQGVSLYLNNGVTRFESHDAGRLLVHLKEGQKLETDMVILSIGVRPETKLAVEAGLQIGARGGILVNEYMQTSDPDIYALGDAVEVKHLVTGQSALIPLAGPANKQGRIVADNMVLGNHAVYRGSIGTAIARVFDLTVAAAGANTKLLDAAGIPYLSSFTHGASHAGYYPDSVPMSLKIIFSPEDGRLLGAQVVGYEGVDKRMEMMAQVIRNRGTVYDLMELEHAYAPPYSSAKDPVNMAGYVADNILSGRMETVLWSDVAKCQDEAFCIDVRTADEFALGHIPGFVNIPLDSLREHLDEIPRDRMILVTCAVGLRGYVAYRILKQHGFERVRNLSGGYKIWAAATAPVVHASSDRKEPEISEEPETTVRVDACGLMCPGPVMKLKEEYGKLAEGEVLEIRATDPAFGRDVASWCRITGAQLLGIDKKQGVLKATVMKKQQTSGSSCSSMPAKQDNKTIVVFSDDLDRVLASLVIANGALAAGKKVTLFFTFWGLNVIKKENKPQVSKDWISRMFGWMMPSSSRQLALSKMHMMGLGTRMMRYVMKNKKVDSLEEMLHQVIAQGAELIACTMSMDVMGVKREELLDEVQLGGVASYLERAEEANMNLFI